MWSASHSTILEMPVTIRTATPDDVSEILAFIRALAAYERAPDAVIATEADLLHDGFGPNPYFFCLIAELGGRPAGFALYFFDYSTWLGRPGLYLEDIFVHPEFRGRGVGKALLERLAAIAVEKGCARLKWEVLDWNTPAIDFYRAMGAEFPSEWLNVCVGGEALLTVPRPFAAVRAKGWETTNVSRSFPVRPRSENPRDRRRAGRPRGCTHRRAPRLRSRPL